MKWFKKRKNLEKRIDDLEKKVKELTESNKEIIVLMNDIKLIYENSKRFGDKEIEGLVQSGYFGDVIDNE